VWCRTAGGDGLLPQPGQGEGRRRAAYQLLSEVRGVGFKEDYPFIGGCVLGTADTMLSIALCIFFGTAMIACFLVYPVIFVANGIAQMMGASYYDRDSVGPVFYILAAILFAATIASVIVAVRKRAEALERGLWYGVHGFRAISWGLLIGGLVTALVSIVWLMSAFSSTSGWEMAPPVVVLVVATLLVSLAFVVHAGNSAGPSHHGPMRGAGSNRWWRI